MAARREVEIILKAKDSTKKGFDSAKKGTDDLGRSADKLGKSLGGIPLQYVAIAASVIAVGKAYDSAINSAGEFQKSVLEIVTLTGANAEETENLSKELRGLSVTFGQVGSVMAKANYNVVSAGFGEISDSMVIMEVASKAAIAGLTDVNTSVKVITQTLNAYGLGAEHAQDVAGDLFAAVKGGVITFEELASSLGRVTGVAAKANIPFEQVAAGMALLTKNGANAQMAATSLAALILDLGAATGESKVLLDELGISLDRGLGPALVGLANATGGSLDKLVKLIPNITAVRAAASAASNSGKDFAEQLNAMADGVDNFDSAYQTMAASYQQAADSNAAAAKGFKDAIGDTGLEGKKIFLDKWTEGLVFMTEVVEENSEGLIEFANNIGTIAGELVKATAGAISFVYWVGEQLSGALAMSNEHMVESNEGLEEYAIALDKATKNTKEFQERVDAIKPPPFDDLGIPGLELPTDKLQADIDEQQRILKEAREQGVADAEAAATAVSENVRANIIAEADALGVDLFKTIFNPEGGAWGQIEKSAQEVAAEITAKLNEALAQEIISAPVIKDLTAAGPDTVKDTGELQLIEDVIEAERLLHEQRQGSSEEDQANQEITLAQLLANREAVEDIVQAYEAAQARAAALASAAANVGRVTVTAFLNGENAAEAFGQAIRNAIVSALAEAIAKAILLQAFKFFTAGIGGVKDGGTIPKMAAGGSIPGIPKAAAGYSVPDGPRGQDSRLIMAMPGEEVINRQMSQRLSRFLSAVESSSYISPWDMGGGSAGGGGTVIMNVGIPQSQAGIVDMQQGVSEMLNDRESGVL